MEKLKGHGYPTPSTVGEVGQHYEDIDTGDIYECRIASKYSPTHGWPVGGYVWERRAKGEDIQEIYGSGGGSGGTTDNRVHIGVAPNKDDGTYKLCIFDVSSGEWVLSTFSKLCEKLDQAFICKTDYTYPQITLTELMDLSDSGQDSLIPTYTCDVATIRTMDYSEDYKYGTIELRGLMLSVQEENGENSMQLMSGFVMNQSGSDEGAIIVGGKMKYDGGRWVDINSDSGAPQ